MRPAGEDRRMMLKNKFRAWCCLCGTPTPPGEGVLLGKDPYLRRWRTRCLICEEHLTCGISPPSVPGFFDQDVGDED